MRKLKKTVKISIIIMMVALLCSCSQTPQIGNGDKPELIEDNFKPNTLDGIDKELEAYERYKKNAESAFSEPTPTASNEFQYTVSENGVRIDKYIGQSETVVIPSQIEGQSVTEIAEEAFYISDNQSKARSIYVPDSVKSIGFGAFKECSALQLIRLPFIGDGAENTHVGYVFGADRYDKNALNIPASLEMIVVGEGEKNVADRAFYGVKSIEAVVLMGAESIGKFAFYECDELCYVHLPDTLKSIGDYSFSTCQALAKIEMPKSVKKIGFGAFYLCRSMCDMTLSVVGDGGENSHIGYIFGAKTADWNEDFVPFSLRRVTLLDTCTRIENKAFANCNSIVEINFSETLEFIGIRSFVNCRSIVSVDCPATLKTISGDAFFGCDNMTSLKVTGGKTEIHTQAFYGCDALVDMDLSGASKIYQDAFEDKGE